ncbi:MAG: M20 family metallo-hydrolase [Bacteroidota bacterium]
MQEYTELLTRLISTPSLSREEENAALLIRNFLAEKRIPYQQFKHNTWAVNRYFNIEKPTILLNSHIDTVKPVAGWTCLPYKATVEGDKITGLGSNDAGGPLVSLLAAFIHFYNQDELPYNLVFAASAEEENSGADGFESIIPLLPKIDFAIVGEPTRMELAIAEKGLLVLDCTAHGKSGHAAREEGENALYKALDDIQVLRNFSFDRVSDVLGKVKITVTQINAGSQHNVVPGECQFVVDVRTNEFYSNRQVFEIISGLINSSVKPRSFRLNSSGIPWDHPFADKARSMGIPAYGSPTTSDQAIMPWPSVKIGPGDSARSHTADEYILKSEISHGIRRYIDLLSDLRL